MLCSPNPRQHERGASSSPILQTTTILRQGCVQMATTPDQHPPSPAGGPPIVQELFPAQPFHPNSTFHPNPPPTMRTSDDDRTPSPIRPSTPIPDDPDALDNYCQKLGAVGLTSLGRAQLCPAVAGGALLRLSLPGARCSLRAICPCGAHLVNVDAMGAAPRSTQALAAR
jgi:hypothetical protein